MLPLFGFCFVFLFSICDANTFNVSEARQQIFQTYSSYCSNSSELKSSKCFWCAKQDPAFFLNITALLNDPKEDLFGFVGFSEVQRQYVVVFRGTTDANPKNWFTNLDFEFTSPYPHKPEILVHQGFFSAYQLMAKNLERELSLKKCARCNKILFLGHSLGGALAVIAAFDYKISEKTKMPLSVFTIGQPRVGNTVFATYFQSYEIPMVRLTHKSDPVPHLPPLTFGYSHFPHEIWEHDELTFKYCQDSTQEDPECSNSVSSFSFSLEDHHHYLAIDKREVVDFYYFRVERRI